MARREDQLQAVDSPRASGTMSSRMLIPESFGAAGEGGLGGGQFCGLADDLGHGGVGVDGAGQVLGAGAEFQG